MKNLISFILCFTIIFPCFSQVLTNEAKTKLAGYKEEILEVFPNIETECLGDIMGNACVDLENEIELGFTPIYTDAQWIDEIVKGYLLKVIRKGERDLFLDNITEQNITLE